MRSARRVTGRLSLIAMTGTPAQNDSALLRFGERTVLALAVSNYMAVLLADGAIVVTVGLFNLWGTGGSAAAGCDFAKCRIFMLISPRKTGSRKQKRHTYLMSVSRVRNPRPAVQSI